MNNNGHNMVLLGENKITIKIRKDNKLIPSPINMEIFNRLFSIFSHIMIIKIAIIKTIINKYIYFNLYHHIKI